MRYLSVIEVREKIVGREGAAGMVCNFCGAPIIAYEMDVTLRCLCFPVGGKTAKTKLYCPLCSIQFLPPSSSSSSR